MGDIAGEAGRGDGRRDGTVVELLRVVQLVAARHAAGVEMGDVVVRVPDRADDVALHDLHVVDVEQQLHAGRPDGPHHRDAERGVVAVVVGVIHLAVQELEAHAHAVCFGESLDPGQSGDAVVRRFGVAPPAPVAEHRDQVRDAVARRERNGRLELAQQ